MKITKQMLRQAGACPEQLNEFIRRYPDGFDATEASCSAAAAEYEWDTGWAAVHLLPAPLLADYRAKHVPLCADYQAAALGADYNAKRAALRADYDAKIAALFGRLAEQVE